MSAPTYAQFMAGLAAELAAQMTGLAPVMPGDFATPRDTTLPSPEASPVPWASAIREGADL